jgi:bifunctional UDP-N-acetylglucosamine pyrophosphorylase/glucosamine-1-phosphate N-acetyltransferase
MHPITLTRPKPLLQVANKTLLQHNLEQLKGVVQEVVVITGYMEGKIRESLGPSFDGMKISYVEQKEQLGTGHALLQAEKLLKGSFVVMMGDDLYSREDIARCARHEYCILGKEVPDPKSFGVITVEGGVMKGLVEKPKDLKSNIANTGLYVMTDKIFPTIRSLKKSERGEYEITDAIAELAKAEKVAVETVKGYWFPTGYPWNLLDANEFLLKNAKPESFKIEGTVEKGVTIKGNVAVGKGTLIKAGSYIEGPAVIGKDCDVGPNCHIRPFTSIGDGCHAGNCVEIKNSILMNLSRVPHLSYVADSVVGEDANVGGGTIVANLRHDGANVHSMINGKLVDTKRRKFGTAIGDGAKLGAGNVIYPGRKIWPGKTTKPGEIIQEDIQ